MNAFFTEKTTKNIYIKTLLNEKFSQHTSKRFCFVVCSSDISSYFKNLSSYFNYLKSRVTWGNEWSLVSSFPEAKTPNYPEVPCDQLAQSVTLKWNLVLLTKSRIFQNVFSTARKDEPRKEAFCSWTWEKILLSWVFRCCICRTIFFQFPSIKMD